MDRSAGINLTKLKNSLLHLNRHGLFESIFHYFSVVVFSFLIWIYFASNFNFLPETYGAIKASDSPLYQSHLVLRILFWIAIILLVFVELLSFWQRRLKKTNSVPMMVLISGYAVAGLFIWVSSPLYNFLKLYFNNTDPFKKFSTPYEVLSNLNYEWYGFFLILAIALFGFSFILLMLRKLNMRVAVIRHN